MAYSPKIQALVRAAPRTLGVKMMRHAVSKEFPVTMVAACTGATRQTVYNWLKGREVTNAYRKPVEQLTEILKASRNSDEAWSQACTAFNLVI